jgi:RNA-directed DNA polymerase
VLAGYLKHHRTFARHQLVRLAKANRCTYSRYADDLTFSTSLKDFPVDLAIPVAGSEGDWVLGAVLAKEIQKAGFEINDKKTRMQLRGSRQVTTGLLVNEKANIRPEYYRDARAMCWSLFNTGSYYRMVPATLAGGKSGDPSVKDVPTTLAQLEGILGHIHYVRNVVDRRDSVEKKKHPTATRKLFARFLFYKNFVNLDKPLIIPEGKSDSIYLRAAIEKLSAFHPKLGTIENGKLKPAARFMNYSRMIHDVLQLGGGTGDFKHFIRTYQDNLKKFRHRPLAHPVIVLIDNDGGADDLFKFLKGNGAPGISHISTDLFYRLADNLYLVKTPETGAKGITCIEDFFDKSLTATKIDGKVFDPDKKHGEAGKYGKVVFAEKVVRPNVATINFSKFERLLDRLTAVLDDYGANPPSSP